MREFIEHELSKGVSRRELARKAGVSLGTVQNILLGDTEIKNSTLDKFYRKFGDKITRPPSLVPPLYDPPSPAQDGDKVTLRDLYELQKEIQALTKAFGQEVGRLKDSLQETTKSLGKEIGDLKRDLINANTKMNEAAETGDISRLGAVGGKGR